MASIGDFSKPFGSLQIDFADGADGDPGTYTITGVTTEDSLVSVWLVSTKASVATIEDVTDQFSITDDDELTSSGTDDFSNDLVIVFWIDRSVF